MHSLDSFVSRGNMHLMHFKWQVSFILRREKAEDIVRVRDDLPVYFSLRHTTFREHFLASKLFFSIPFLGGNWLWIVWCLTVSFFILFIQFFMRVLWQTRNVRDHFHVFPTETESTPHNLRRRKWILKILTRDCLVGRQVGGSVIAGFGFRPVKEFHFWEETERCLYVCLGAGS